MVQISDLPRDPGPAAWDAILPTRESGPHLQERKTADWLIVGAGFAGLAAARRLRQLHPRDRVVILEARTLCEGPIGRNSGFMIDVPHVLSSASYSGQKDSDRAQIRANRAAIGFAREAVLDYGIPAEAFDAMGKVNGAMTEAASAKSKGYANHLTSLGEDCEFLDAQSMREMTGSDAYVSGLYTPGTVILQPAIYARGMAAGLNLQDVEIYENSPVIGLESVSGHWVARTPEGQIEAPKVILAVNGQIERFGHFQRRLLHVYLYASMTRALTDDEVRDLGGHPKWAITPADPMGSTVRRISGTGGHRIVVRNRASYDPSLSGSDARLARFRKSHQLGFERRFPNLKGMKMEFTWGGALCLSRTGTPAFGEVLPNLYAATCQNGLGTVQGTLSGMLAADLASGRSSDLLTWQLARPVPTPLAPLTDLGARPVLRFKEFMARSEI